MRLRILLSIGLLILASSAYAQKHKDTSPDTDRSSFKGSKKGNKGSNDSAPTSIAAQTAAQLQTAIDVRKSRVGDEVIFKTTQSVKQNGETVVPKGTALVGKITEIQRNASANGGSRIGILLNEVQRVNGVEQNLTATVVSITSLRAASPVADASSDLDMVSTGSASSGRSTTRSGSGGGGLLSGVGSAVGSVVDTTTQTVGGVAGTATGTAGSVVNTTGSSLSGIRVIGSGSANGSSSSTLVLPGGAGRLEKGAAFQIQLNGSVSN